MNKRDQDISLLQQLLDAAVGQGLVKQARGAVNLQEALDRLAKNDYPGAVGESKMPI